MNLKLKTKFEAFVSDLETYSTNIGEIVDQVQESLDTLQEQFDKHSDDWKDGDSGVEAQEELDALQTIIDNLTDIGDNIDNTVNDINAL